MLAGFAGTSNKITIQELNHSIKRNFGGFEANRFDPLDTFRYHYQHVSNVLESSEDDRPPTDQINLLDSCLSGKYSSFPG